MWCHGRGCARPTVSHGLRPATTMARFSSRKTAIRRTTQSVRFFSPVICLEMVELLIPQSVGACLEDVSLDCFCLLVEQDRLRALLHHRYLRRGRCRLPKSRQWREEVLDALPDDQRLPSLINTYYQRQSSEMDRSNFGPLQPNTPQ